MNKRRIVKLAVGNNSTQKQYVLYWMQQSQRVHDNHALSLAIAFANKHKLPLLVLFVLTPAYPYANYRHMHFMFEGLQDVKEQLESLNITFVLRIGAPDKVVLNYLANAECLVMDTGYLTHQVMWRKNIVDYAKSHYPHLNVWQVESDAIVPVRIASPKAEYGAYTLRPKLTKLIEEFIDDCVIEPVKADHSSISSIETQWAPFDQLVPYLAISLAIGRSPYFKGGSVEAEKRLNHFLQYQLAHYLESDDPSTAGTSTLAPYMHFGQIAPLTIVNATHHACEQGWAPKEVCDAFLEQVIIRRELAINYVTYVEGYDRFSTMTEPWAYQCMKNHLNDPRQYLYTAEDYVQFRTHDPYFNAAMKEMVFTGYMHNYMRMYWAKKIIEWSHTYEQAYQTIVLLNNTYFIDGRDANSYAGIAWVFGKHDRPWIERPIFGKIRYMNASGLERKFNIQKYVESMNELQQRHLSR